MRRFFGVIVCCFVLSLLVGCLAPPKRHAWQITREDVSKLKGAGNWPEVSTNDYVRVIDSSRTNAVALLQKHSFVPLDASQLSSFAPSLANHAGQAYLVRGVAYSPHPFTIVRHDDVTGNVLVEQFTWNGEMLMPFRWVAEPNAFVMFLSRAPECVYPAALLDGDGIFRGRDPKSFNHR